MKKQNKTKSHFKKKVANMQNYKTHGNYGNEIPYGTSMTTPNQTMSLEDMLNRYANGGHVEIFTPKYDEAGDIPINIERLDEMDRQDLIRDLRSGITRHQLQMQDANNNKTDTVQPTKANNTKDEKSGTEGEAKSD